jgi:hypothetical protein
MNQVRFELMLIGWVESPLARPSVGWTSGSGNHLLRPRDVNWSDLEAASEEKIPYLQYFWRRARQDSHLRSSDS